jgi:hypothetical protein
MRAQQKPEEGLGLGQNQLMNGGNDPYRQSISALRDRFNPNGNLAQNQQAPGLGAHSQPGALSPGRFNSPGRMIEPQQTLAQKYQNQAQPLTPQTGYGQTPMQTPTSLSPGRNYGQEQTAQNNPIKIYGGNDTYQNSAPQNQHNQILNQNTQQRVPSSLNDRINPNYSGNPFSPQRQNLQQNQNHLGQNDQIRRFGGEETDFQTAHGNPNPNINYEARDPQQTLRDRFGGQETNPNPNPETNQFNQPRFVRSQPRPTPNTSTPQTQPLHQPTNTESRVVP